MAKRVLVISYYWPPSGGSGVQRWLKFSRYLPSEGWMPVVYTPSNPDLIARDESLAGEVPSEVEVIRRPIFEPYALYRKLLGRKGPSAGEVNPINAGRKSLFQRIALFIRGNFFVPDPRCLWMRPSVKFLKKYLREHPVDAIVSTGPPHSMHLIAKRVSKALDIPWVADFRDPWTKMFYFKHLGLTRFSKRRHRRLEKSVLDSCSAVVAVSPLVQKEFQQMTSTVVHLITNGYDQSDFAQSVEPDGYFNLVHTGLFASDGNPTTLWKVLSDKASRDPLFAQKLRIRLCGKTDAPILDAIHSAGLSENLIDRGYQPHGEAVREQKGATILLLPLRKEPEYKAVLPGKLFEYLAARHPILGIGQSDGAMATIVRGTLAGETLEWDDESGIRNFIDLHWEAFLKGESLYKGRDISSYSRKAVSHQMAELLDSLIW